MSHHLTLGTAGHIDHGKTALVRALTGVDTDRLPEEKRRGITIDLGFARLPLGDGVDLGIVDVPGHEAFVRNMLAGATGIDLVLLVIAADEGVMPQTREHLAIIELLGVPRGVVAITKADLVEAEWLELVKEEARELLAGGRLEGSPLVVVSARTGAGLDTLVRALRDAAGTVRERAADDAFRMPIDRVFTVRGTGTVVTGTVWSGSLRRDSQVRIQPSGLTARVRGLQHHGIDCESVAAGERAAVALAGVDRLAIARGDALVDAHEWEPSRILTAELRVLPDAGRPLRSRQRVRVHVGTAEVLARVALPAGELGPGGSDIGQLRLEQPLLARALDHLVIRSYSPVHTIAGGVVLEPAAPKRKRFSPAQRAALARLTGDDFLAALLEIAGPAGVARSRLPLLTGRTPAVIAEALRTDPGSRVVGDSVVALGAWDHACRTIAGAVDRCHTARPLEPGVDREQLRREVGATFHFDAALQELLASGVLASTEGLVARAGFHPRPAADDVARLRRLAAHFAAAGTQAPELEELPPELGSMPDLPALLRLLERDGVLVRLGAGRWADAASLAAAASAVREQLVPGEAFAVADFKRVVNLSRKHLLPLLEYFDRQGVTRREGDARVVLPAPDGGEAGARPDLAAKA